MPNSNSNAPLNASNVKLPPISNGVSDGVANNGGSTDNKHGEAAIRRITIPGKSQQLIYRSIPPKVQNFTFSDMLDTGITPNLKAKKPKGASFTSSSEFAKRFMSRPTTQPKVIEFNAGTVKADKRRRGINGFFPPVKLRISARKEPRKKMSVTPEPTQQTPARLQLIPTSYSEVRPRSSKSRSISRASRSSVHSRKTPDSIRTAPPGIETLAIYPETFDCDDFSFLPPPKRILPKRDVPWVYRYKVKRNMNELSKIMASKPPQMINA